MVKPLPSLAFRWISLFLIIEVGQCLLTCLLTCRKTYEFRETCNINAPIKLERPSPQPYPTINIALGFVSALLTSTVNYIFPSLVDVDMGLTALQDCWSIFL